LSLSDPFGYWPPPFFTTEAVEHFPVVPRPFSHLRKQLWPIPHPLHLLTLFLFTADSFWRPTTSSWAYISRSFSLWLPHWWNAFCTRQLCFCSCRGHRSQPPTFWLAPTSGSSLPCRRGSLSASIAPHWSSRRFARDLMRFYGHPSPPYLARLCFSASAARVLFLLPPARRGHDCAFIEAPQWRVHTGSQGCRPSQWDSPLSPHRRGGRRAHLSSIDVLILH